MTAAVSGIGKPITVKHWTVALLLAGLGHGALVLPLMSQPPASDERAAGELVLSLGGAVTSVGESRASDTVETDAVEAAEAVEVAEPPVEALAVAEPAPVEAVSEPAATPVEATQAQAVEPESVTAEPVEMETVEEAVPAPVPQRKPRAIVQAQAEAEAQSHPRSQPQARPRPPAPAREAANSAAGRRTSDSAPQRVNSGRGGQNNEAAGEAEKANFAGLIRRKVLSKLRYPSSAKRLGITGTPTVRFQIDDGGNLRGIALVKSSGNTALDEEAMAAIRRAAPFRTKGRPPLDSFVMPVTFVLN